MDSNTSVAIMFASAFGVTAFIINSLLNYRLQSRMLKMGTMDTETLKLVKEVNQDSNSKTLKWGLILFFGGMGLIVLHSIGCKPDDLLPYGIEAMFIAAGLFAYYMIIHQKQKTQ